MCCIRFLDAFIIHLLPIFHLLEHQLGYESGFLSLSDSGSDLDLGFEFGSARLSQQDRNKQGSIEDDELSLSAVVSEENEELCGGTGTKTKGDGAFSPAGIDKDSKFLLEGTFPDSSHEELKTWITSFGYTVLDRWSKKVGQLNVFIVLACYLMCLSDLSLDNESGYLLVGDKPSKKKLDEAAKRQV